MSILLSLKVKPGEPVRRGNAHYWSVIRDITSEAMDAAITVAEIVDNSNGGDPASIRQFLRQLVAAGIASGPHWVPNEAFRWRLLKRPTRVPCLSRDGRVVLSGQEQMWNAIRALKVFDAPELVMAASTEDCQVTLATALTYLKRLNDAGYLKVEHAAKPGKKGRTVYRLKPAMNTGPLAPKILRTKLVYDPNKNEVMGDVIAEEEA